MVWSKPTLLDSSFISTYAVHSRRIPRYKNIFKNSIISLIFPSLAKSWPLPSFYSAMSKPWIKDLVREVLPPYTQNTFAQLFSSPSMPSFSIRNIMHLPASLLSSCSTLKHLEIVNCEIFIRDLWQYPWCSTSTLSLNLSDNSIVSVLRDNQQEKYLENILRLATKLDYLGISGNDCQYHRC